MRFLYFFLFLNCQGKVDHLIQTGSDPVEILVDVPDVMSAEYVNVLVELQEPTATRHELIVRSKKNNKGQVHVNYPVAKNGINFGWIGSQEEVKKHFI